MVYSGVLSNTDEGLKLFDGECGFIDEVLVSSRWLAGDNIAKKTMERNNGDLNWHTSAVIGGTPKKENSQPAFAKKQETAINILEEIEEDGPRELNQETLVSTIQNQFLVSSQNQISSDNIVSQACGFVNSQIPGRQGIIINEVAWMGTISGANDEWIELKNISGGEINLSGWQLIDQGEQIKITFGNSDKISAGGFFLLERTDDNSAPNIIADKIYTGVLSNANEGLRLFSNNCGLIDEVLANPDWPAGDSAQKRSMERSLDFSWHNYNGIAQNNILGTPKAENSAPTISNGGGGGSGSVSNTQQETVNNSKPEKILISEIQINGGTGKTENDFIELYNPNDFQVNLNGYRLAKRTKTGINDTGIKSWTADVYIPANSYYLWANNGYADISATPDATTTATISNDNGVAIRFGAADTGQIIDSIAWGEAQDVFTEGLVFPTNPLASQSIQRKFQNDIFIDTDNNASDFEIQTCPSPKTQSKNCSAANQAPNAFFVYTPQSPNAGDLITFDAASSTDFDGQIVSFQWDFDGGQATTTQASAAYSYQTAGDYAVQLIIYDNNNASSTTSMTISVQPTGINRLVISEIMAGNGAGRSNEEFIELYNPTDKEIDLNDWSLKRKTSQNSTSTLNLVSKFSAASVIPAKRFFLVAHQNYFDYSSSTAADFFIPIIPIRWLMKTML